MIKFFFQYSGILTLFWGCGCCCCRNIVVETECNAYISTCDYILGTLRLNVRFRYNTSETKEIK